MWNMRGGGMGGEGGVEGGLWYTELNNALGISSTYICRVNVCIHFEIT